jgi:hypothetical protein
MRPLAERRDAEKQTIRGKICSGLKAISKLQIKAGCGFVVI